MARVLLIDDETINNKLYATKLASEGHTVVIAQDGEQARSQLRDSFDLVLLDLMIPKVDGMTLLSEIRSGVNKKAPVLIFTNLIDEKTKQQCLEKGATEVLFKADYTPKKLMEKLTSYLGKHQTPALGPNTS